jgi:hypothetical protein
VIDMNNGVIVILIVFLLFENIGYLQSKLWDTKTWMFSNVRNQNLAMKFNSDEWDPLGSFN